MPSTITDFFPPPHAVTPCMGLVYALGFSWRYSPIWTAAGRLASALSVWVLCEEETPLHSSSHNTTARLLRRYICSRTCRLYTYSMGVIVLREGMTDSIHCTSTYASSCASPPPRTDGWNGAPREVGGLQEATGRRTHSFPLRRQLYGRTGHVAKVRDNAANDPKLAVVGVTGRPTLPPTKWDFRTLGRKAGHVRVPPCQPVFRICTDTSTHRSRPSRLLSPCQSDARLPAPRPPAQAFPGACPGHVAGEHVHMQNVRCIWL